MSRTYRRRGAQHEYCWVLRERVSESACLRAFPIDRHSREGRRALARFHSDAQVSMKIGVPYRFRRSFKKRQATCNARELRRWFLDPDYDPVIDVKHRHAARWAWW